MTPEQKAIEAIRAYLILDFENNNLKEVALSPVFDEDRLRRNITLILNHFVPCKQKNSY